MQKDSSLPCFAAFGEQTAQMLRDRFQQGLTQSAVEEHVSRLIETSLGSNWTRLYDSVRHLLSARRVWYGLTPFEVSVLFAIHIRRLVYNEGLPMYCPTHLPSVPCHSRGFRDKKVATVICFNDTLLGVQDMRVELNIN